MSHTIAGFLVQGLLDGLVARGCDEAELRARAHLPPLGGLSRLPYAVLDDLMEAGLALTGDPRLGLHLAGCVGPEHGGPIGILLLACPDFGTAIGRALRFQRLFSSMERMRARDSAQGAYVELRVPDPARPGGRQVLEWMMADVRMVSERLLGYRLAPRSVHFAYPAPEDASEYEAWFDAPVRFDAPANRVYVSRADWHAPVKSTSATIFELLERQLAREVEALPTRRTWGERVRERLASGLPEVPTVDALAAELRVSARSLQRALRNEGHSISSLLDEVRRTEAEQWLLAGIDIGEISWRLGYSGPRAFHRAFRRWHGTTPELWRAGDLIGR